MNWYGILKFSQIWNVEYSLGDFESELQAFYELEYKYSMFNLRSFKGTERRAENIDNRFREQLAELGQSLKEPVLNTLERWLEYHALLNPEIWAVKKVEEVMEIDSNTETILSGMIGEYNRYKNNNQWDRTYNEQTSWSEIAREIPKHLNNMPVLTSALSMYLDDEKNMLIDDLNYEGIENFNERFGQEFSTLEEAEDYIDNLDINNFDIYDYTYDREMFVSLMDRSSAEAILAELYKEFVFPLWFSYWKGMGIEATREIVEEVYEGLKNTDPRDVDNFIVAFNSALQVEHQNGSMLTDYLEPETGASNLKDFLDALSNKSLAEIEDWNEDLRKIGVEI